MSARSTRPRTTTLRVWGLPEMALRREDSRPEVYPIRNRCKTWVESQDVLLKVLGRSWGDVRLVPDGALAAVPDGSPLVPFWGTGRLFPGDYNWWLGSKTSGVLHWYLTGQGVR